MPPNGVWEHALPEKFGNLDSLRTFLRHFDSHFGADIVVWVCVNYYEGAQLLFPKWGGGGGGGRGGSTSPCSPYFSALAASAILFFYWSFLNASKDI